MPADRDATSGTRLPVIPLRDMVVFPRQRSPFVVGRPSSVAAVQSALAAGGEVLLLMQRDPEVREPGPADLHEIGTLARIVQHARQADGTLKLLVEGLARASAAELEAPAGGMTGGMTGVERAASEAHLTGLARALPDTEPAQDAPERADLEASLRALLRDISRMPGAPSLEASLALLDSGLPARACDDAAARLPLPAAERQRVLDAAEPVERMRVLETALLLESEKTRIDGVLQRHVQKQVEQSQREYLLGEKLKAIHKELGRKSEAAEAQELLAKVEQAGMPEEARSRAIAEIRRLESMPAMSAEAGVIRSYVEWLLALPWNRRTEEQRDFDFAERVLDEDHHGLERVKERILEFLAVRALRRDPGKGSILCLVGPPGVGKTSLGRSIARATGRAFVRVSLGGVRDEAEMRGHRRTYVGAYPGRILQMLKRAGTRNPVMLLDEIDKLASDFRGDPTSALLEVLDPEQNATFADHYLDVPFDLSEVLFICTANLVQAIPDALRDRLEIIRLAGYTPHEKRAIAESFLLPRQLSECGLAPGDVRLSAEALDALIDGWTREAGVRGLEREIAALCRKAAARVVRARGAAPENAEPAGAAREPDGNEATDANETADATDTAGAADASGAAIPAGSPAPPAPAPQPEPVFDLRGASDIQALLGPPKYRSMEKERRAEVGVAMGLAWTEVGGQVLLVEATRIPGKGQLVITGRLGDVMQESLKAALTWVRARAERFGLAQDFLDASDVHVHLPEGAIPKDGPSAGITMALAVLSALTGRPVRHDIAMTGEITLRGRVLPVGGIKEKLLAAHRAGLHVVMLPADNARDLEEIPQEVRQALTLQFVSEMDEVVQAALLPHPGPAALAGAVAVAAARETSVAAPGAGAPS